LQVQELQQLHQQAAVVAAHTITKAENLEALAVADQVVPAVAQELLIKVLPVETAQVV
jgi:hypothetical protein